MGVVRFSSRVPPELQINALSGSLEEKRKAGIVILDLTESNPTRAGILYPSGLADSLADDRALLYEPEPFGLLSARELIGGEYECPVERVILTASTSEAYSWLFKLLCDPGDEILVPRPSYPLFEHLAAFESVRVRHYGLFYDYGWHIDFATIKEAMNERTRAIIVVNPNNPTGNFLKQHEVEELAGLGLPIISDEVFRDYALDAPPDSVGTLQGRGDAVVFTLNGLSKSAGLPQMKLAWMIGSGPVDEALKRLELIADTYLSVGAPVQYALPAFLEIRKSVQTQITARARMNIETLRQSGERVLKIEGGWYAILPRDESTAVPLLREHDVLVQPGYFYDFESSRCIVISLLTPPEVFREGLRRLQTT